MPDDSDDSDDDGYNGYGGYNEYAERDRGYYYRDRGYERKTSPMMSPIISPWWQLATHESQADTIEDSSESPLLSYTKALWSFYGKTGLPG
ncbi:hypothetical protein C1646_774857 [Rhizophagus diaphanus]|nr:hypothetical protein C1646_774857 [Rhizophagus diaphanus] [Rhizophagus sp. MUCL 43196]